MARYNTTFSPLRVIPLDSSNGNQDLLLSPQVRKGGAVYFLWHYPSTRFEARRPHISPRQARGYVASCPLVFGLSSSRQAGSDSPSLRNLSEFNTPKTFRNPNPVHSRPKKDSCCNSLSLSPTLNSSPGKKACGTLAFCEQMRTGTTTN